MQRSPLLTDYSHDIEVIRPVQRNRIAVEKIGHDDEVAIRRELVGDQLRVDELVADNVGQDEDREVGALVLRVGEVGRDCCSIELHLATESSSRLEVF